MEHIRSLEKFLENADVEEIKFIRSQLKKLHRKFDTEIKGENAWKPWTPDQEQELLRMKNSGLEFDVIASEMKRTKHAIERRCEKIMSRDSHDQSSFSTNE